MLGWFERYSRPEMVKIWDEETKFSIWRDIESFVLEGWAKKGIVPPEIPKLVLKAEVDPKRVREYEASTGHEVTAFVKALGEKLNGKARSYLHLGITSSDIIDTTLSLQMLKSTTQLISDIKDLLQSLKRLSLEHKDTLCVGRTHGVHAEPTTFGTRILSHYAEFKRNLSRLQFACEQVKYGKISGAVGTYSTIPPDIERYVLLKLGLQPEPVSTQIVPRDRYSFLFSVLGIVAGAIERFATNIRTLQRSEIDEVEEPFGKEQMGSSIMPHKRNPVLSENLCGLARTIRASVALSLENIALWDERDISHSSAERVTTSQVFILTDFALSRLKKVVDGLNVKTDNMRRNLLLTKGLIFSSRILTYLVENGVSRDLAYKIIQEVSFNVNQGKFKDIKEGLLANEELLKMLNKKKLGDFLDGLSVTKPEHIDLIFKRTLTSDTRIIVKKRAEVLDPEGRAIASTLKRIGFDVEDVRVGKVFFIRDLSDSKEDERAESMCKKLLANPIVEEFDVQIN